MTARNAFIISLVFIGLGLMLSGYLTYYVLFTTGGCHTGFLPFLNCGSNPVTFWGVPQCVVGFSMYLILAVVTVMGLYSPKKKGIMMTVLSFGVLGTLFSASLSVYELFIQTPRPTQLPACVYGFFFYLGVLIVSALGLRSYRSAQPTAPQVPPQTTPPQ